MALMAKDKRSTTMINYSIVMRSVNANIFDINQAKSRIKAAEKAGQTPSPEDVALVATEKQNAFAIAQYADVMTIEKFAKHIATHGCVYSRADISAILYIFAQILIYCGSIFGIDSYITQKIKKNHNNDQRE